MNAQTTFGRVRTDCPLTVTGSINSNSVSGSIGGGGCELTLQTSNADIELIKAVPAKKP